MRDIQLGQLNWRGLTCGSIRINELQIAFSASASSV